MGRIINEDDVIALINGKIDNLEYCINANKNSAESDKVIAIANIPYNAKLEMLLVLRDQLKYIAPYKFPEPRPLHELLAEDENIGSIPQETVDRTK